MVVGRLAVLVVAGAVRDVALQRRPQHQRARRLVEGADRHQDAADVGMDDDRIGLLARLLRAGQRAALAAVARIERGVLVGDLRHARGPARRRRAAPRSSS